MDKYQQLLEKNKKWAAKRKDSDHSFFEQLSKDQSPDFLFIGCSDSRVPPEIITGSGPGEMFVHRNVGNVVDQSDKNILSVIEYAVVYLKVKHIIVCGHYGCGGVQASMAETDMGVMNPWISKIRSIFKKHRDKQVVENAEELSWDKLVELNVIEQCRNVTQIPSVKNAIGQQSLQVHGWVFDIYTGKLIDLDFTI